MGHSLGSVIPVDVLALAQSVVRVNSVNEGPLPEWNAMKAGVPAGGVAVGRRSALRIDSVGRRARLQPARLAMRNTEPTTVTVEHSPAPLISLLRKSSQRCRPTAPVGSRAGGGLTH
jgi:hypothetical protein